jgi:putative ABC transport system permease protein
VTLPADAYDWARAQTFVTGLRQALHSSAVAPVGFVDYAPLQPSSLGASVRRPQDPRDDERRVQLRSVSAATFDALDIPLVAGRIYTDDSAAAEIVVNETLARMFWPDSSALGERLIDRSTIYTVVGVVKDVRFSVLGGIEPMIHTPRLLSKMPQLLFKSHDRETADRLRATVLGLEPRASVSIAPLTDTIRESLRFSYTGVIVGWLLGGLALLLAIVGVFGVFSYIVEERTREIGIRMALGARRSEVLALVFRATRSSLIAGLSCTVVLAVVTGFALRSYLFGLSPFDPLAYAGAATLIALAALIATALPVRRATRVDPVLVLRLD